MLKFTTLRFALALAITTVGCAGATSEEEHSPVLPTGLTVESQTADSVEGRYQREAGEVRFSLTNANGVRSISLRTLAGNPLLSSTVTRDVETIAILGDRLRMSGPLDASEPTLEGDPAATETLASLPEAAAIADLPRALDEAFPGLLDAVHEAALRPAMLPAGSTPPPTSPRPRPDLAAVRLVFRQSVSFTAWRYSTRVYWAGYGAPDPSNCIGIKVGTTVEQTLCHPTSGQTTGYWYNRRVTIRNVGNGYVGNELLVNVY